jgi:hypothetical protein
LKNQLVSRIPEGDTERPTRGRPPGAKGLVRKKPKVALRKGVIS